MYDAEKRFAVLENAPGFTRLHVYIYSPITKSWHWGMFVHWGNKCPVLPNFVRVGMPPALRS